jgi:hypothetical protein
MGNNEALWRRFRKQAIMIHLKVPPRQSKEKAEETHETLHQ